MRSFVLFLLLSVPFTATVAAGPAPAPADDAQAFLLFRDLAGPEIRAAVEDAGARIVALFPESRSALVAGPGAGVDALIADPRVAAGSRGLLTDEEVPSLPERQRVAAAAWNHLQFSGPAPLSPLPEGEPLVHDVFEPPPDPLPLFFSPLDEGGTDGRPFGASWDNTSEFLAGRISLNLFLMESDGSLDPSVYNWTLDQESRIQSEVLQAVSSVATVYPTAGLSFTIHLVSGRTDTTARTKTEPINRSADPGGTTGEDVWVREILARRGYSDPYSSRWTLSRRLADATRLADGSDWAVSVYVAHTGGDAGTAGADADGKFADGRFGYAWFGGPHIVLTYSNDGWGIGRFDMVLLHELHHSFFALDEYQSANCSCTAHSGYLDGLNDNCQAPSGSPACPTNVSCVMRSNVSVSCDATRRQVGTWDTDADGTPDVSDVPPSLSLVADTPGTVPAGRARLSGSASVGRLASRNPGYTTTHGDFTVVRLVAVETSVDDGPWEAYSAVPSDGAFDGFVESYSLDLSLAAGPHWVATRAVDARGHRSAGEPVLVTVEPVVPALGTPSLTIARQGSSPRLTWGVVSGAARYSVRRTVSSPPSAFLAATPADVGSATAWVDGSSPSPIAYYRVFAVDGEGTEYPSPGDPSP